MKKMLLAVSGMMLLMSGMAKKERVGIVATQAHASRNIAREKHDHQGKRHQ